MTTIIIFIGAFALASPPAEPAVPTADSVEQADQSELVSDQRGAPLAEEETSLVVATPAERLVEGWERVRRGDYEGGTIMAEQVLASDDSTHEEEALYLKGFSLEWGEELHQALPIFEEIQQRWPDGEYYRDSLFRKTETLGKMRRYDEALRLLREHFESDKALNAGDQLKVELLKGIWMVEQGKTNPGIRRLSKGLAEAPADQVTWYQAQANSVLIRTIIAEIESLALHGSTKKMQKQLTTQATLMLSAEQIVRKTVDLEEPAWIIDQLHLIGNGYQILGDHLRDAPPVEGLDDTQLRAYNRDMRSHIENLYVKGVKYYDLGLEHANRVQWSGKGVETLLNAREGLSATIESL